MSNINCYEYNTNNGLKNYSNWNAVSYGPAKSPHTTKVSWNRNVCNLIFSFEHSKATTWISVGVQSLQLFLQDHWTKPEDANVQLVMKGC